MQKSASPKSKTRRLLQLASLAALALAAIAAVTGSDILPAQAATLAHQADAQIAVFLVPVALLMAIMLFEAVRFVLTGPLPAQAKAPKRPARRTNWSDTDR